MKTTYISINYIIISEHYDNNIHNISKYIIYIKRKGCMGVNDKPFKLILKPFTPSQFDLPCIFLENFFLPRILPINLDINIPQDSIQQAKSFLNIFNNKYKKNDFCYSMLLYFPTYPRNFFLIHSLLSCIGWKFHILFCKKNEDISHQNRSIIRGQRDKFSNFQQKIYEVRSKSSNISEARYLIERM